MKKIRVMLFGGLLVTSFLSSCVVGHQHYVTGNPIGTKKAVIKSSTFKPRPDFQDCAKSVNISKIGSIDITSRMFIIPFEKTVITGE
jgi:hypothetical protein